MVMMPLRVMTWVCYSKKMLPRSEFSQREKFVVYSDSMMIMHSDGCKEAFATSAEFGGVVWFHDFAHCQSWFCMSCEGVMIVVGY